MDEELYTGEAKKSSRRVEPENQTKQKRHSDKLKNEASAGESYRKKLRHGKKDNTLSKAEQKQVARRKRQGRKKIYSDVAMEAKARQTIIQNEDDNAGTDALNAGLSTAEAGVGQVRESISSRNYSKKLHARSEHLDAVQGAKGAKMAGEAGESTKAASVKAARKKLMQKEFAEAAYKKQAAEAANSFGSVTKRFTDKAEDLMGRLAEWLNEFVEDHPGLFLIIALILIVVLIISGSLTSCSALISGGNNAVITTSFTAQDADILEVEADYVALETDLQTTIDNVETDYPGYDEYN